MLIPWHMSFLSYFFIYTTLFLFLEGFLLIFLWCKSGSNGLFFFSIKFTFLDLYYSSIYFIEMHFCFVYTVLWGFFFAIVIFCTCWWTEWDIFSGKIFDHYFSLCVCTFIEHLYILFNIASKELHSGIFLFIILGLLS